MNLPDNVDAVIHHANGDVEYIYSPFPIENRWPEITVSSSSFRELPVPDKFYEQAIAFLQAAGTLCERTGESGKTLRWSEASVCYYSLNIATELFLKACILRRKGDLAAPTHAIPELLEVYRAILPEKEFQFETMWSMSWRDLEGALGQKIVNEVDHHPDQLFRYGTDRNGKPSAGTQFFSPNRFYSYVSYLRRIWQSAWSHVSEP